jgi:hypothetical protein
MDDPRTDFIHRSDAICGALIEIASLYLVSARLKKDT